MVDEFILYDDMQFTRRDWRNRNKIKTPQGTTWLTVPVKTKGKYQQSIFETKIDGTHWAKNHLMSFIQHYSRAPYYKSIISTFEPYYNKYYSYLYLLNRELIVAVCNCLGINTKISNSSDYKLIGGKNERLAELCAQAGGTEYVSGPAAKKYLDEEVFLRKGIQVTWHDYSGYPEYPQLWGPFVHEVTVLDLLFNTGTDASWYIWGWRDEHS